MKLAQGGHAAKLKATTPTRRASGLLEPCDERGAADSAFLQVDDQPRRPGYARRYGFGAR